jgi:hypothetical protein
MRRDAVRGLFFCLSELEFIELKNLLNFNNQKEIVHSDNS